jgi:GT2 family glycosyltransferase
MSGDVFVLIVNWNGKEDTLDCLRSLEACQQEIGRVLVVDNGSTDGSVQAIKRHFPEVTVIENGENLGFGPANNIGMRLFLQESTSPYLLLLNSDTLVTPGALRILVSGLTEAGVGAAVPKIYYADGQRLWYAGGRIDWKQGSAIHFGQGKQDEGPPNQRTEVGFATGCALLLKREALEKVGLFDERYFMFGEDVDLSIRLVRAACRILYLPEATIRHKVGSSVDKKGDDFIYYHMTRNRLLTMSKHAGWAEWLPFAFYFPFLWGWKAVSFLLQGEHGVGRAMVLGAQDFLKQRFGASGFDPSGGTN